MLNFRLWIESFIESKDLTIRESLPHEVPKYFIHRTDSVEDANNIKKNNFDLKYFGKTGKKYRVSRDLVQYDPKGVYCLPYKHNEINDDIRPHVVFSADIAKSLIILGSGGSTMGKRWLYSYYHAKSSSDFAKKLLNDGYQAILTQDSECIILDIKSIRIL